MAALLLDPFRVSARISRTLILLFLFINALVLTNALLHDPTITYDGRAYRLYTDALSLGHLPTPRDTHEYFSPPLPFALAAGAQAAARHAGWEPDHARAIGLKCAQLSNVLWSLLLTIFLLKLCRLFERDGIGIRLGALAFCGLLPIYFRMFANVRGEPIVASLAVVAVYLAVSSMSGGVFSLRRGIALGCVVGLLALARQWAVFVLLALAVAGALYLVMVPGRRAATIRFAAVGVLTALLVSGWFYASLQQRYGSIAASNWKGDTHSFALSNQPASFYFDLVPRLFFGDPIFPSFPNRVWPIYHSALWGDYWGYWVVTSRDTRDGAVLPYTVARGRALGFAGPDAWLETNRREIGAYLGRVNAVALLPSLVMFAALLYCAVQVLRSATRRDPGPEDMALRLCALVVLISLAGYFFFLVKYPVMPYGNTIKAGYQLQIYPMWAVLVASSLDHLRRRWPTAHRILAVGLALAFLHSLPVCLTRFAVFPAGPVAP